MEVIQALTMGISFTTLILVIIAILVGQFKD